MKTKTPSTETGRSAAARPVRGRKLASGFTAVLVSLASVANSNAAVWLNETFEGYTAGTPPNTTLSPQLNSAAVATVIDAGGNKVAQYAKTAAAAPGGSFTYSLSTPNFNTARPKGFVSFKVTANATPASPVTGSYLAFRLGTNDAGAVGSTSNAFIDVRLYQPTTTFGVKVYSNNVQSGGNTTALPAGTNIIRVWYNSDTVSMPYTDPSGNPQTLAPATYAAYVNNLLINSIASGSALAASVISTGTTASSAIGKIGFVCNSGNTADFSVDDLYAADTAPAVATVPVITSAATANGFAGVPFSYQIVADTATSFGATGLPAGLTVNSTSGLINGTPTTLGGPTAVTLTAANGVGTSSPVTLQVTISPPLNTFSGSDPNMNTGTWSLGQSPTSSSNTVGSFQNLTIASSVTSLTTISANVYAKTWNVTNGSAYNVASTSPTTTAFRMGNTGSVADTSPFDNVVSGVQNDLVYLSNNSNLTFSPANATVGSTPSTVELRNSGNFNVSSGSILDIQTAITDNSTRALTKTGTGTAILSGANSYRGGTTLANGTLTVAGSSSPSVTARATATLSGGQLTAINLVDGGSGYTVAPSVTIAKGTGEGTVTTATATATISGGAVTGFTITNPGANYTVEPLVYLGSNQSPLGTGAVTLAGGTLNATVDADLGRITPYAPTGSGGSFYRLNGASTTVNAATTVTVADTTTLSALAIISNGDTADLITKNGPGTLWLRGGGSSTFTGGWKIDAGTLFVGTTSSQGLGSAGKITMNGGNLRFSKGISSTGTYTGHGQDLPLEVLQNTTITLDANPLTPSGSNTVSFVGLTIGTNSINLLKSAAAKSSADEVGYSDPQLSFLSASLSGTATLNLGNLTQASLQGGTGTGGITKTGPGKLDLSDRYLFSGVDLVSITPNSYTGATAITAGTLSLSGSHASAITLANNTVLEITLNELGSPVATSTSSLTFVAGSKVRIAGTPVSASYTLVSASSISGTPVLETVIPGYSLVVVGSSLKLNAAATGYSIWAATHAGAQTADLDYDNDGVANGVEYFMGQTGSTFTPSPGVVGGTVTWPRDPSATAAFKVQISDTLAAGGWTDIVPPHASINTSNPNQVVYTLPTGATRKFCRLVVTP